MKNILFLTAAIGICGIALLVPVNTAMSSSLERKTTGNPNGRFKIGFIKDQSLSDGCSCTFGRPSQIRGEAPRYLFVSDVEDEEKTAWLNIDGEDVRLKLLSSRNPGSERVGSRSTRTYAAAGLTVTATYVATWVCPLKDEACEVTRYRGDFKITKGGVTRILQLKGECGC